MSEQNTGTDLQTAAEFAFLGCLMNFDGEEAIVKTARAFNEGAKDEWFQNDTCRLLWHTIAELWANGKTVGCTVGEIIEEANRIANRENSDFAGVSVSMEFTVKALEYVNSEKDLHSYAEILRNASTERELRKLFMESNMAMASSSAMAVGNELTLKVQKIISQNSGVKEIDLCKVMDDVMATYETAYDEIVNKGNVDYAPGFQMPWRKMTRLYNGFTPGYHIVAARPSVGKTSFVLQLMRFWMDNGYKVAFNCLDMGIVEAMKRPLSERSRVGIRKAQFGNADKKYDFERMYEAANKIKELYKTGNFTVLQEYDVNAFKSWCVMRKSMGKLDMVVIDFMQLMRYSGSDRLPETQKVTFISGVLKSISNELNIPVIALSQLKRASEFGGNKGKGGGGGDAESEGGREPELSDLRSSGAIEQDAFTVTFLYRDDSVVNEWQRNPPTQFVRTGGNAEAVKPIWVHLKKNQNGDTGRIPFVVYQNVFSWYLGYYKPDDAEMREWEEECRTNNQPKRLIYFSKVYDDWRHDSIENVLKENGVLMSSDYERERYLTARAIDTKNDEIRHRNDEIAEAKRQNAIVAPKTTQTSFSDGIPSVPMTEENNEAIAEDDYIPF